MSASAQSWSMSTGQPAQISSAEAVQVAVDTELAAVAVRAGDEAAAEVNPGVSSGRQLANATRLPCVHQVDWARDLGLVHVLVN